LEFLSPDPIVMSKADAFWPPEGGVLPAAD